MENINSKSKRNFISNYLYTSWIQTCGEGWTMKQIIVGHVFALATAAAIIGYGIFIRVEWSIIQYLCIALLVWDLGGGVVGYNHKSIKVRQLREKHNYHHFHHNMQHIHPLVLIFFNNQWVLLILTSYWLLTFFLYVEFMEVNPKTNRRKSSIITQKWVIAYEAIIAGAMIGGSYLLEDIDNNVRLFGAISYLFVILCTQILLKTNISFQRTLSIMMVIAIVFISMFFSLPGYLLWLVPMYFLKLLPGFTAKEMINE